MFPLPLSDACHSGVSGVIDWYPFWVLFFVFCGVFMNVMDSLRGIIDNCMEAGNGKPDAVVLSIREYDELMGEIAEFDPVVCDKLSFSALRCCGVAVLRG